MTRVMWNDSRPANGGAAVRWLLTLALVAAVAAPAAWGQPSVTSVSPAGITNYDKNNIQFSVAGTGFVTGATAAGLFPRTGGPAVALSSVTVKGTEGLTAILPAGSVGNRLRSGDYDMVVATAAGASTGSQNSLVTVADDHADDVDHIGPADTLVSGSTVLNPKILKGEIGFIGDVDFFKFDSEKSLVYRIIVEAGSLPTESVAINGVPVTSVVPIFCGWGAYWPSIRGTVLYVSPKYVCGQDKETTFFLSGLGGATGSYQVAVVKEPPSVTALSPSTAMNSGQFDVDIYSDPDRNPTGRALIMPLCVPGAAEDIVPVVTIEDPRFRIAQSADRIRATGTIVSKSCTLVKARFGPITQPSMPMEYRIHNQLESLLCVDEITGRRDLAHCANQIFISVKENKSSTGPATVTTFEDDHPNPYPDYLNPDIRLVPRNPQDLLTIPGQVRAVLGYAGDRDAFILKSQPGKPFNVMCWSQSTLDMTLVVRDPAGRTFIATDDIHPAELIVTSPRNTTARATFVTTLEGDYVVTSQVFGTGCNESEGCTLPVNPYVGTGQYIVSAAQDEHPTCPEDTMPVYDLVRPDGKPNRADVNFLGDTDCFQFSGELNQSYLIRIAQPGRDIPSFTMKLYGKMGTCSGANLIATTSGPSVRLTTTVFLKEYHKIQVAAQTSVFDNYPLPYQLIIDQGSRPSVFSSTPTSLCTNNASHEFTIRGDFLRGPTFTNVALFDRFSQKVSSLTTTSVTTTVVRARLDPGPIGARLRPDDYSLGVQTDFGSSTLVSQAQVQVLDDHLDNFNSVSLDPSRPADQLTSGTFVLAELGYANDRDYFVFKARPNTQYAVEVLSAAPLVATSVDIIDALGNAVASGTQGAAESPSPAVTYVATVSTAPLNPTTHYVRVSSSIFGATGAYQLRFREIPVPIVISVVPARPGRGSNGGLVGGSPVSLTVRGDHFLTPAKVTSARLDDGSFTALTGIDVASQIQFSGTVPLRAIGAKLLPGFYHVLPKNGAGEGPALAGGLVQLEDEHPERSELASAADRVIISDWTAPVAASGDLGFGGDLDYLVFGPTVSKQSYLIECSPLKSGSTVLTVAGQNGSNPVTSPASAGPNRVAFTASDLTAATTAQLRVAGATPVSTTAYSLRVLLDDHPNTRLAVDLAARAQDLLTTDGTPVTGVVEMAAETDVFRFPVTAGAGYIIRAVTSGPQPASPVTLTLLGPSGLAALPAATGTTRAELQMTAGLSSEPTNYAVVSCPLTGTYQISVKSVLLPIVQAVTPSFDLPNTGGTLLSVSHQNASPARGAVIIDSAARRVLIPPGAVQDVAPGFFRCTIPTRTPPDLISPGLAHLVVLNADGESGSESGSTINFVDDHPETAGAVGTADGLDPISGRVSAGALGFPADVDYWRFSVTAGSTYIVELSGGPAGGIDLALQDSSGQALSATVTRSGAGVLATYKPATGGLALVRLRSTVTGQCGGYSIKAFLGKRPSLLSLAPSRLLTSVAGPIQLAGTGFTGVFAVRLADARQTPLSTPVVSSDSSLRATVPAGIDPGVYGLVVTNAIGASGGDAVRLHIDDHPNTIAETGPDAPIAPRDLVLVNRPPSPGVLEIASDRDVFLFPVQPHHTYTVQTSLVTLNDTYLTVFARDGTTVMGQNDNVDTAGGAYNSSVTFTAMETATYYARVDTLGATGGIYRFSVSDSGAADDHPNLTAPGPNAPFIPRDLLSEGVPVAATIEYPGDVDFYLFQALAGAVYDLETTLGSVSDTVLTIFDRDGATVLAENDDNPESVTSRASKIGAFQPRSAGTYYAAVRHFSAGLASATGSYTLMLTRRSASIAVLQVRAPRISVSRGQVLTVEVEVQNTGSRPLTSIVAGLDFSLAGRSSAGDYTVSAQAGNVTSLPAGQNATFRYRVTVSGAAVLGATVVGGHASGRDGSAAVSSPPSFVTTGWAVQTPAAVSILTFTAPTQVSRGQTTTVTMVVSNSGQARVAVELAALRFVGSNGSSRDGDYVIVPSPSNPVELSGATGGATPLPGRTSLAFSVAVKSTATTETVAVNGSFTGRDLNSGLTLTDDAASTPVQWTVQTGASLLISAVEAPSMVSRGQSVRVFLQFENPGQSSATILAAALRFLGEAGGDLGAEYQARIAAGANLTVQAGNRLSVPFDVTVGASASLAPVLVDGLATARDDRTGRAISLLRANAPAWWSVQAPAELTVTRVQASPAQLARGGAITLTLTVENPGAANANLSALGFQLLSLASGADRASLFTIAPAAPLPLVLAGGATVTVTFTATAGPLVPFEQLRVSGTVVGTDANSGARLSSASSAAADPLISVLDARLTIVSPLASAVLYPDEPIPFRASLRTSDGSPWPGPTEPNFLWRSSVSGTLGGGEFLPVPLPIAGAHLVSVTAAVGAAVNLTTATPFVVLGLPSAVNALSVSGAAVRTQALTPLADGFRISLRNATRGLSAEAVTAGGRYTVTFASGSGAAAPGDVLTAQLREPGGVRRPTSPDRVTLLARDIAAGRRTLDLAAADLVEGLAALSRGLNLMAVPVSPATTTDAGFNARELAQATRSAFVVRFTGAPGSRSRSEGYLASQAAAGFAIRGNEGYLVSSPSDQLVRFRGSPWPASQLYRLLPRGASYVGLPQGTPPGLRADELLQRSQGATSAGRLVTDGVGGAHFELYLPGVTAPFDLLPGRGYLLNLPAGGDVILPLVP